MVVLVVLVVGVKMLNLASLIFLTSDIVNLHDDILPAPADWVNETFIDYLTPNVVVFLSALAAISVFRSLMRF